MNYENCKKALNLIAMDDDIEIDEKMFEEINCYFENY